MERFNNPLLAGIALAAFIGLCAFASKPHENVGYSAAERHQIAVILAKEKPISDKQRHQLAELFNTRPE
jgi:hypothetical protein